MKQEKRGMVDPIGQANDELAAGAGPALVGLPVDGVLIAEGVEREAAFAGGIDWGQGTGGLAGSARDGPGGGVAGGEDIHAEEASGAEDDRDGASGVLEVGERR